MLVSPSRQFILSHLKMPFIHCSIECRFYHPCGRTGYAGFSIQARFLNSVWAVLSLNSFCQFILCINNLLPWEVIFFGMFYHLFCCLDHMIQSFSMTLCSIILWSFPTFSFSSWSSHSIHRCLLIQISLAILGRQPLGPVIGSIRWAAMRPILFASFFCRTWVSLGVYPQLVISCMTSLWPAVSQAAGLCSFLILLSQHIYVLIEAWQGGLHFSMPLLHVPHCFGWVFCYPLYLRC